MVVDLIAQPLERLPPRGELTQLATLETHLGGNGPNCAAALARLGTAAAVAGRVGRDLFGRFLMEELARLGVETGAVISDPTHSTGVTLVALDGKGERTFVYYPGANARFGPSDVRLDTLPGLRALHAGSHFVLPSMDGAPLGGLLRTARERGIITTLDVCWDASGGWLSTLAPCLPHADYFLPSEAEAAALTGAGSPPAMAAALHAAGARAVIVKCAERGCFASAFGEQWWEPAFEVEARDATGAGDCFIAGFLAGLVSGWDLRRALRLANACGALAVGDLGATTGIRPLEAVERWMTRHRRRRAPVE
jgi:sugar/nucleoside kinase (ribokinase family)